MHTFHIKCSFLAQCHVACTSLSWNKMHSWAMWAEQVLEETHIRSLVAISCVPMSIDSSCSIFKGFFFLIHLGIVGILPAPRKERQKCRNMLISDFVLVAKTTSRKTLCFHWAIDCIWGKRKTIAIIAKSSQLTNPVFYCFAKRLHTKGQHGGSLSPPSLF